MYWLASSSTCSSISSSRKPAGISTFLLITAAAGNESAKRFSRDPSSFQACLTTSTT